MDLTPAAVTAALVGVKSRLRSFGLQRWINKYPEEPLLAVLPGVALQELWQIAGVAETALIGVSAMVVVTALLEMMAMIFSSLNERRREMAIWRAMGARPGTVLGLLVLEAALMAGAGALLGPALLHAGLAAAQPLVDTAFGLWLPIGPPSGRELAVLAAVVAAAATGFRRIGWDGLIPPGVPYGEIIGPGQIDEANDTWNPENDENAKRLNMALDGAAVRLPGYIRPFGMTGDGVTSFMPGPDAGACIHTPTPPPNQLVFVTTGTPWPGDSMWQAVWISGPLSAKAVATEVAEKIEA